MAKFIQSTFLAYSFITLIVSSGTSSLGAEKWNSTLSKGGRILGGSAATLGQFPYLVYVQSTLTDGVTLLPCGGALLSETFVVTAAQCVVGASAIKVVAGVLDPADTSGQTSFGVSTIHPSYRKNFQINDIALIRLLTPFTLGPNVYPIKLAKNRNPRLDRLNLKTAGWGPADGSKTVQTTINYVELKQLSKKDCLSQTKEIFVSYPAMTSCLDSSGSTRGFCYGDSGAPVVFNFPDEIDISLVGILSQYQYCPKAYPMSYTKIGPFNRWIKNVVKRLLNG